MRGRRLAVNLAALQRLFVLLRNLKLNLSHLHVTNGKSVPTLQQQMLRSAIRQSIIRVQHLGAPSMYGRGMTAAFRVVNVPTNSARIHLSRVAQDSPTRKDGKS